MKRQTRVFQNHKLNDNTLLNPNQDSKKKSFVECLTDIVIGFVFYLPVNFFVLPLFVDQIANQDFIGMMTISLIFTSIALVRKFTIRRWFENMKAQSKLL